MASDPTYLPLDDGHLCEMSVSLRPADRRELLAATGRPVLQALRQAAGLSAEAYAALLEGRLVAVFGVAPLSLLGGVGVPWMIATKEVEQHGLMLTRAGLRWLARWRAVYPALINHVDQRNQAAVSWLYHLGFEIHPAVPLGPFARPFHRFEWHAPNPEFTDKCRKDNSDVSPRRPNRGLNRNAGGWRLEPGQCTEGTGALSGSDCAE